MKKLEQDFSFVKFFFENNEDLELSKNDLAKIVLEEVNSAYSFFSNDEALSHCIMVNDATFVIKKQANKVFYPFGQQELAEGKMTIFERLDYGDITDISFLNSKKEEIVSFTVPYVGDDLNIYQYGFKEDECLIISICRDLP